MVLLNGSDIPSASAIQFIEFAVPKCPQAPQPGVAASSISFKSSSDIVLVATFPAASYKKLPSIRSPLKTPAYIGPPAIIMDGIFNLAAAINMPGVILSQLLTITKASN